MGTIEKPRAGDGPGASGEAFKGTERRSQRRVGLNLPLSFLEVAARPPVNRRGVTLDVSRTGVRFRSAAFLPPKAFVALEVSLPGQGNYAVRGRAVWARRAREDEQWEVGAEFLRAGGDADAALAEALLLRA
jgi:hypothetical protein